LSRAIKTKTLWQAVKEIGRVTASVNWPVSAGAPINYNIKVLGLGFESIDAHLPAGIFTGQ
jgi:hypothetical protein